MIHVCLGDDWGTRRRFAELFLIKLQKLTVNLVLK